LLDGTIDLNFARQSNTIGAFLYETSEGPILLETGPFSCYPMLCKGIRELGYAPKDIRHVFVTQDAEMVRIGDTVIRSWHTPGHAKHHIAWQINRELIAGDVAGVRINDGPVVAPCPPPDIDLEDWAYSIRRMKALDLNRLHLTHFGSLVNIHSHLEELEKTLKNIKKYEKANPAWMSVYGLMRFWSKKLKLVK